MSSIKEGCQIAVLDILAGHTVVNCTSNYPPLCGIYVFLSRKKNCVWFYVFNKNKKLYVVLCFQSKMVDKSMEVASQKGALINQIFFKLLHRNLNISKCQEG